MNVIKKGYEEIKWYLKYNTLRLKNEIKEKNRLKEIDNYIQQLAEMKVELDYAKTREKLARKQIKELKAIIKDQKEEEKNVRSN